MVEYARVHNSRMNYWLLKTEPSSFSIDDLEQQGVSPWDGVRNYQARNNLRAMEPGDQVLIYHSSTKVPAVVGVGEVVGEVFADLSQFNPKDHHYEPKAVRGKKEIWLARNIRYRATLLREVSLEEIKRERELQGMVLTHIGSRLSVQPVKEAHFKHILAMGNKKK